ncbi:variable large family protein (plasmid) [Borrelia coriaceae]|uniref:variable large family protein n=1 Tax=Borrelia coriaceae TaxID=144 RepID=UPI0004874498|nr:variable large family protein [Borrelia coriaceae]UPA17530.1 variable large family protein [Borrelia coriaceae]
MNINIKNIRLKSICATLFISLFLSCNNGIEELQKQNQSILSISNLRQNFLDVFASFGEMFTDTLGIKSDTKKSEIGKCFTKIIETMKTVKEQLTSEVVKNEHYSKVKKEVEKFVEKLVTIEKGAEEAFSGFKDSTGKLGDIKKAADSSTGADATSVGNLVKGIRTIVEVVLEKEGDGTKDVTKATSNDKQEIGKLFGDNTTNGGAEAKHIAAAGASIGAVTGADILKAIANSSSDKVDVKAKEAKDAAGLAMAKCDSGGTTDLDSATKKDAVMSAGIALRAMAKGGNIFVKSADSGKDTEVGGAQGVAVSAVNKTLNTLIIAIRNTVDNGLRKINDVLATVKQEDKSEDTTNTADITASGQK